MSIYGNNIFNDYNIKINNIAEYFVNEDDNFNKLIITESINLKDKFLQIINYIIEKIKQIIKKIKNIKYAKNIYIKERINKEKWNTIEFNENLDYSNDKDIVINTNNKFEKYIDKYINESVRNNANSFDILNINKCLSDLKDLLDFVESNNFKPQFSFKNINIDVTDLGETRRKLYKYFNSNRLSINNSARSLKRYIDNKYFDLVKTENQDKLFCEECCKGQEREVKKLEGLRKKKILRTSVFNNDYTDDETLEFQRIDSEINDARLKSDILNMILSMYITIRDKGAREQCELANILGSIRGLQKKK